MIIHADGRRIFVPTNSNTVYMVKKISGKKFMLCKNTTDLLITKEIIQKITGISSIIADQRFTVFIKSRRSQKQTIPVEKSARTLTNYYSFDQRIS